MRVTDVNAFKGKLKDAMLDWAGSMIDQILPNKVAARTLLKNAVGNVLARADGKINEAVDAMFLMFGDAEGTIDADSTIDQLCDMLKEMNPVDYPLGVLNVTVGGGEISVKFPHNIFSEIIVGELGGVRITSADIKDLKKYF